MILGKYRKKMKTVVEIARGKREEQRRWGVVAVGAIRCFEPQVVANHLLGLKDSKLRADMGLYLHWLQRPVSEELTLKLLSYLYY